MNNYCAFIRIWKGCFTNRLYFDYYPDFKHYEKVSKRVYTISIFKIKLK